MGEIAKFAGVFALGYSLNMGVLYVVLTLFPRRKDQKRSGSAKVSGNSGNKNHAEGPDEIGDSEKINFANG